MTRFLWAVVPFVLAVAAPLATAAQQPDVRVRLDSARREVLVEAGPLHVPEATPYSHHPSESRLDFDWPVEGWIRGYRIDLVDAEGRPLPRTMLHHAGVANLERRQLAYPIAERLFAVGRETTPVMLPSSMGVSLRAGQRLRLYFALVNETKVPVDGARLQIRLTLSPEDATPRAVFPVMLDANPRPIGGTRAYDVPPGLSVTSAEVRVPVGGHLRALGAHLHDHAVEIRLEDVITGRVMARLGTHRRADGGLVSVDSTRFALTRRGLRLDAGRPYRVVAVYDNPTGATIRHGAMAFLAGPFVPDDVAQWPALDTADSSYQRDLEGADAEHALHAGHTR
jgi:hypothetical protein